ncbi:predicted protein [Sclerotinia sclerotiorum 1980 UF-70]|nr:predicted protein [Sclerotinia sclerotiorum 1980 UF-70]EDN95365.1 predicted protein [Sclerotinia sclerotiorum 1980 UF-70]
MPEVKIESPGLKEALVAASPGEDLEKESDTNGTDEDDEVEDFEEEELEEKIGDEGKDSDDEEDGDSEDEPSESDSSDEEDTDEEEYLVSLMLLSVVRFNARVGVRDGRFM